MSFVVHGAKPCVLGFVVVVLGNLSMFLKSVHIYQFFCFFKTYTVVKLV